MSDRIRVISDDESGFHSHGDVELIYPLVGRIEVRFEDELIKAPSKSVLVINSGQIHSIHCNKDSMYMRVNISYFELIQSIHQNRLYFSCNSLKQENDKDFSQIRSVLEMLLNAYAADDGQFKVQSLYYYLWNILCQQFLVIDSKAAESDSVIERIIQFINQNYKEAINQNDIAEKFFMSQSAFSKYFKKQTGKGFKEYVNELRIDEAKRMLSDTNYSITEIALNDGFKTVTLFNKNFKYATGQTPSEYRIGISRKKSNAYKADEAQLLKHYRDITADENVNTIFDIDVNSGRLWNQNKIEGICGGFVSDLKNATIQLHLKNIVKKVSFEYVNIYNALDDAFENLESIQRGEFDFESTDQIIDFLLDLNLKPYFELPGRSRIIMSHIGGEQIEYKNPRFTNNRAEDWEKILEAFLIHIIDRYSSRIVSQWRFEFRLPAKEIANPLNYLHLYETSYKILKSRLPEIKIGALNVNAEVFEVETDEPKGLEDILSSWKKKGILPDFFTIMSYPYGVSVKEDDSYQLESIRSSEHFIRRDIEEFKRTLVRLEITDIPIIVSEWNTSLSQRNSYNDSCGKACHMIRQMIDMANLGVQHFFNGVSDRVYQYYDTKGPLIGASALITKDGIFKPSYYAFELWCKLGNDFIDAGENYIVTSQSDGSVQILVFNAKEFSQSYLMNEENRGLEQDISSMFRDENKLSISFNLHGMSRKEYSVRSFKIKESEGSILSEFRKLGKKEQLIKEEIDYLDRMCTPRIQVHRSMPKMDVVKVEVELEPNEIEFILVQ